MLLQLPESKPFHELRVRVLPTPGVGLSTVDVNAALFPVHVRPFEGKEFTRPRPDPGVVGHHHGPGQVRRGLGMNNLKSLHSEEHKPEPFGLKIASGGPGIHLETEALLLDRPVQHLLQIVTMGIVRPGLDMPLDHAPLDRPHVFHGQECDRLLAHQFEGIVVEDIDHVSNGVLTQFRSANIDVFLGDFQKDGTDGRSRGLFEILLFLQFGLKNAFPLTFSGFFEHLSMSYVFTKAHTT